MLHQAGDTLGPYEILAPLGSGGMGDVYRARDARVGRDVAIKVAAERFSDRFEREARAVAALNHPNICHLYDVGPNYLVMELVEGESPSGPLPLDETLQIAKQIADALSEAHEKGIVHRDLKPANIKVTANGIVKVLDFGLARVTPASGDDVETSPTLTAHVTQAGVIMGTAAYMAPEQARGKVVDKRADIWAFGVVLYELLIGERPFKGDDVSEILAAVLKDRPDWDRVPPPTRRLLKKCLEKDPKLRLRDIGDAWALLEDGEADVQTAAQRAGRPWLWPSIASVFALTAAVAAWAPWRTEPDRPLVRLEVDLGADVSLPATGNSSIAISPDGTRLVYVNGSAGGPNRLFTRRLEQTTVSALPGTEGAQYPFFSPDGRWIGFIVQSRISKISVDGGAVVPIADAGGITPGASWAADDTIVAGALFATGLRRVRAGGGDWTTLTELGKEAAHVYPHFLPGANAALFTAYRSSPDVDQATIDVVSFADGARKTIVRGGTSPQYLSSGHLLYTNRGSLFAIPFDPERLETRGTPLPVLDDVRFSGQTGAGDVTVSAGGTLVYRAGVGGTVSTSTRLEWIDANGKRSPLTVAPGSYTQFRLSPDGTRVAITITEGGRTDIWVHDSQRNVRNKLTFTGTASAPMWSPDGRYVVFSDGPVIRSTRADGAGEPQPLVRGTGVSLPFSFTQDGKRLAFVELGAAGPRIYFVSVANEGGALKASSPEAFMETRFVMNAPAFSPDGQWLAYISPESGRSDVYVRRSLPPSSGQSGRTLVSTEGGANPRWASNGRELLFTSGERIMAVSYTVSGDAFVADAPRVRVEKLGGLGLQWDLAPDGRIAVLRSVETPQPSARDHTVVFLQNFFDELRRRVPVGR